uniref:Uncharacterized protein n=1 Tax=Ignisphaera aggregans TaxID=334771 RepID=A0A7C5YWS7_9CREN
MDSLEDIGHYGYEDSSKPSMIRSVVKGTKRMKVMKIVLRVVEFNNTVIERDMIRTINIGLKYLSGGRFMALSLTNTHEMWMKPVNCVEVYPHWTI